MNVVLFLKITNRDKELETTAITTCMGLAFISQGRMVLAHIANMCGYPDKIVDFELRPIPRFAYEIDGYPNTGILDFMQSNLGIEPPNFIKVFGCYSNPVYNRIFGNNTINDTTQLQCRTSIRARYPNADIVTMRGSSTYRLKINGELFDSGNMDNDLYTMKLLSQTPPAKLVIFEFLYITLIVHQNKN